MQRLRAAWRLARAVVHGLHGLAIVLWRFPSLDERGRHERIGWWAAGMLRALGMRLAASGTPRPGAKLIVANHVSWLDIMAIHAVCPEARFVSKAEVRHWPLVNRLVDSAGTLYLEREKRRDALRVVHHMAEALQAGQTVAVFPEGTTGRGPELLPFHANLLQAAIATATPVQPVALRYADAHGPFSCAAEFVGETTLAQSLWRLACGDTLVVHVDLLAPEATAHADRRALAERLRSLVAERLPAAQAAQAAV
ncbi:MAG: 1-acyl-sn-glycerol-3-phosphate acyltransferase [Rubrivivax sp.]|jgi:1-acyl-sn-glycerol-3-phosphate acyltransferase|nr:1-acyl-sn-glycerol-3-phosphate acyltransferase [Rubrivivax sp.]